MFSHNRALKSSDWGATSRMFCCTVSGASGKLTTMPVRRWTVKPRVFSVIQARGRKDMYSSVSRRGSTCMVRSQPATRFRWLIMAPLGSPVVPEV